MYSSSHKKKDSILPKLSCGKDEIFKTELKRNLARITRQHRMEMKLIADRIREAQTAFYFLNSEKIQELHSEMTEVCAIPRKKILKICERCPSEDYTEILKTLVRQYGHKAKPLASRASVAQKKTPTVPIVQKILVSGTASVTSVHSAVSVRTIESIGADEYIGEMFPTKSAWAASTSSESESKAAEQSVTGRLVAFRKGSEEVSVKTFDAEQEKIDAKQKIVQWLHATATREEKLTRWRRRLVDRTKKAEETRQKLATQRQKELKLLNTLWELRREDAVRIKQEMFQRKVEGVNERMEMIRRRMAARKLSKQQENLNSETRKTIELTKTAEITDFTRRSKDRTTPTHDPQAITSGRDHHGEVSKVQGAEQGKGPDPRPRRNFIGRPGVEQRLKPKKEKRNANKEDPSSEQETSGSSAHAEIALFKAWRQKKSQAAKQHESSKVS